MLNLKKINKQCVFIKSNTGVFVPTPTSWGSGLSRKKWFEEKGIKAFIASPKYWNKLKINNKIKKLVEYSDKSWEIKDE